MKKKKFLTDDGQDLLMTTKLVLVEVRFEVFLAEYNNQ